MPFDHLFGPIPIQDPEPKFEPLARLGYLYAPYLAEEMHWFCKPHPSRLTHHLHLAPVDSSRYADELAFRDRLRADPNLASEYLALKRELARRFACNREAYTDAKSEFVRAVVEPARLGRRVKLRDPGAADFGGILFDLVEMEPSKQSVALRYADEASQLHALEPLWNALQEHHSMLTPSLGDSAPKRELGDSWRRRSAKYERWLQDPETFFIIAEKAGRPVGYAFVTVGQGYAAWRTGDRLAELETLSVLPENRGDGVGTALLESVQERLVERGVEDLVITALESNVDSHRFYERHGFSQGFVVYYGNIAPAVRD